jgi:hypothetical protein
MKDNVVHDKQQGTRGNSACQRDTSDQRRSSFGPIPTKEVIWCTPVTMIIIEATVSTSNARAL